MLLDQEVKFVQQIGRIALLLIKALEVIVCHLLNLLLAVRLEQIALAVLERHLDILCTQIILCVVIIELLGLNILRAAFAVICLPDCILLVGIEHNRLDGLLTDACAREEVAVIIHAGCCIGIRRCELLARKRQTERLKFFLDCDKGLAVFLCLVLDPFLCGRTVDIRLVQNLLVIRGGLGILKGLAALAERFYGFTVGAGCIIKINTGTDVIIADGHGVCRIFAAGSHTCSRTCRKQDRSCFFQQIHG